MELQSLRRSRHASSTLHRSSPLSSLSADLSHLLSPDLSSVDTCRLRLKARIRRARLNCVRGEPRSVTEIKCEKSEKATAEDDGSGSPSRLGNEKNPESSPIFGTHSPPPSCSVPPPSRRVRHFARCAPHFRHWKLLSTEKLMLESRKKFRQGRRMSLNTPKLRRLTVGTAVGGATVAGRKHRDSARPTTGPTTHRRFNLTTQISTKNSAAPPL
ncbi:hypothetical protein ACLOJK_040650 [Asimina triloba]